MYCIISFNLFLAWLGLRCCAGFSLVAVRGGQSLLQCSGFSLQWLLLLWSTGSRARGFDSCGSWALEHSLNSCGTPAWLLHGMGDLPGSEIKPVCSRFFISEPQESPCSISINEGYRDMMLRAWLDPGSQTMSWPLWTLALLSFDLM